MLYSMMSTSMITQLCIARQRIVCESAGCSFPTMSFGQDGWAIPLSKTVKRKVFVPLISCSTQMTVIIQLSCRFGTVLLLDCASDEVQRMRCESKYNPHSKKNRLALPYRRTSYGEKTCCNRNLPRVPMWERDGAGCKNRDRQRAKSTGRSEIRHVFGIAEICG